MGNNIFIQVGTKRQPISGPVKKQLEVIMNRETVASELVKVAKDLVSVGDVADTDGNYTDFTGTIDYKGNKGVVRDATFELIRGKITWEKGDWIDGIWKNGKWEDGKWYKGIWRGGRWLDRRNPHPNER